jgi:hypothetical protein
VYVADLEPILAVPSGPFRAYCGGGNSPRVNPGLSFLPLRGEALRAKPLRAREPALNTYSCLATISLSLRDKNHPPIEGLRIKLALIG